MPSGRPWVETKQVAEARMTTGMGNRRGRHPTPGVLQKEFGSYPPVILTPSLRERSALKENIRSHRNIGEGYDRDTRAARTEAL